MTLTEQQIEELFRFCEKKAVRFYDLQAELVDHLAERVEEEISANDAMSFEDALKKVYAGFGLFGFNHIVQDKQAALQKQHNRTWRRAIKQYFTLPKLLFTAALFMVLFTCGKFIAPDMRMFTVCLLWFVGYLYQIVCLRRLKKCLTQKLLFTQYAPFTFFLTPLVITNTVLSKQDMGLSVFVFALLCLAVVVLSGASVEVTKKIYSEARRLYPKAFTVA